MSADGQEQKLACRSTATAVRRCGYGTPGQTMPFSPSPRFAICELCLRSFVRLQVECQLVVEPQQIVHMRVMM